MGMRDFRQLEVWESCTQLVLVDVSGDGELSEA